MVRTTRRLLLGLLLVASSMPALAQQTTGNISGRALDPQGGAMPGVSVTAKSPQTGFTRAAVTDAEGVYRLSALPVGSYDLTVELQGFSTMERKGIVVNVGQTLELDFDLKVAQLSESVTVTGETPLLETSSSSVGGVVDVQNIESLPLNGRQFANLALTIPGVGLGFHSDPTKSTQFSPQIAGGNGRNVNYQIDGGDNNDDTVGGLLQLFPLEAIQEFNFQTARYKAEYGRSNGGVMNIVTKSGTNQFQGSGFTLFRDNAMNAKTETEKLNEVDKQEYRRYQFGGSFGGPILQNRAHFFAAAERTQLDTKQAVDTFGLFPAEDGIFVTPIRENLVTAKSTMNVTPTQYLAVRYGRNTNSQPYGAGPTAPVNNWGVSDEHVQFDQREPQLGARRVEAERVHLPVCGFFERDHGQQPGSVSDLPQRRDDRAEPEHAAADAAAEVAVPERLFMAHHRHGWDRPRLQDRRQLHQRAETVHHVQHWNGWLRLPAPR